MTLQQILFGSFQPPPVLSTRYHYIDARPEVIAESVRRDRYSLNKRALTDYQKRVLMIVKCNKITLKEDVAKKTKVSSNHAGVVLTSLYKASLIERVKVCVGKRWAYGYTGKAK